MGKNKYPKKNYRFGHLEQIPKVERLEESDGGHVYVYFVLRD